MVVVFTLASSVFKEKIYKNNKSISHIVGEIFVTHIINKEFVSRTQVFYSNVFLR